MKKLLPLLVIAIAILPGCSGGNSSSVVNVSVSVSPSTAQLDGGQTQQFTATVSGSSNTAVTWSISPSAAGTIDSTGLFTAEAIVPSQSTVTVTATSQADTSKSASATVTLIPVSISAISPASVNFGLPGTQQFSATVQGSTNTTIIWTLTPPTGSGTIDNTGFYTTPSSWTPGTPVTVTATAAADNTKWSTATVNLESLTLQGQYAFFFQGNDASGNMMQAAGSFAADGSGNVTGGVEDIVLVSGAHTSVAFAGTYTLDSDNDGRGTLTITDALGTRAFNFNLNAQLLHGRFTEDDATGYRGVGLMELQDSTAFPIAQTAGDYAFGLSGSNTTQGRVAAVGRFHLDGSGSFSAGEIDINDAGSTTAKASFNTGTYTAPGPTTGRGTAVLDGLNMTYYVVSADEAIWVTVDNPGATKPIAGGHALRQSGGPFALSSLSTGLNEGSVFYLVGAPGTNASNALGAPSDVAAGIVKADGSGNLSITSGGQTYVGEIIENSGGAVSGPLPVNLSGTYTVDSSGNGRGTMHFYVSSTYSRDLTFYFVSSNTAFLLDGNESAAGPNVGLGYLEAQTVQNCGCTNLVGNYVLGSVAQATASDPVESGNFSSPNGNGTFTGNADYSMPTAYEPDQAYSAVYDISGIGRGTATRIWTTAVPPEVASEDFIIYLIVKDRGIAFSTSSAQTNPVLEVIEK